MSKQTVPCHVDMSNTSEFLYAHVDLSGVQVGPGDQVLVHDPIVDITSNVIIRSTYFYSKLRKIFREVS